jgi:hypothetical protein
MMLSLNEELERVLQSGKFKHYDFYDAVVNALEGADNP